MLRIAASERVTVDAELLAALGGRHALSRTTTRMQDAAIADSANRIGDVEIVLLIVTRVDTAGRTTRIERFKPDDLGAALARLVELHADDELPPDQRQGRCAVAEMLRNRRIDWTVDAIELDHRPASEVRYRFSDAERWRIVDIFGFTEELAFIEILPEHRENEGDIGRSGIVVIDQFGGDGLVHRSELYSAGQLDEAFARFDQLSGSLASDAIPPPNAAALELRRANETFARQDLAGHVACFAPLAVHEDRRPRVRVTLTGRDAMEQHAEQMIGAVSHAESTLLATRGDRLSLDLVRYQGTYGDWGSWEDEMIHLTETDEHGRISYTLTLLADDLDAGFAELDARYAAGEGRPFDWASDVATAAAYNRHDWAAYESSLAEDFQYVDHRAARFGEGNRTQFISAYRTVFDLVPDAKMRVLAVPRLTTTGGVCIFERTGHDQTGAPVSWREIGIFLKAHGLFQFIESFPIDHLQVALAQFDQHTRPDAESS